MKTRKKSKQTASIHELLAAQRKQQRKQSRQEYCAEHRFEIINVILSSVAIIISIIALIVSIIAL